MADPNPTDLAPYNPHAIFDPAGPINPTFMTEAVRTLLRTLPLDPTEPAAWASRRMFSAMQALAALHPRDEIEVMLGVQALSAYHAAAACWHLGMNHHRPNGDSTRHISSAASSARTFDTLLKAIERRHVKPPSIPVGRPAAKAWPEENPQGLVEGWAHRCRGVIPPAPESLPTWSQQALATAAGLAEMDQIEQENAGLDIASTEGILSGGGMIMPEEPTPRQAAYLGRRMGLRIRREYEENIRKGIKQMPKIRPTRPGDFIP